MGYQYLDEFRENVTAPIVQGAVNYAFAEMSSAKAKERQMELMRYADDINLEWYERNKSYNAPAAQMQRLKEAGLNPNMMYGSGQGANTMQYNATQSAPNAMSYKIDPVNILGTLGAYQDVQMKKAQVDNVKLVNEGQRIDNQIKGQTIDYAINKIYAESQISDSRAVQENLRSLLASWQWERNMQKQRAIAELKQYQSTATKVESDAYMRLIEKQAMEGMKSGKFSPTDFFRGLYRRIMRVK